MDCSFPGEATLLVEEFNGDEATAKKLVLAYCDATDRRTSVFKCPVVRGELPTNQADWESLMQKENLLADLETGEEYSMSIEEGGGRVSQLVLTHLAVMTSN
jgi:hypothetical protein